MAADVLRPETHPLVRYGERRGWSRQQTADFFEVPFSTFKQLVSGHTGASFTRAEGWETRSGGEVLAVEVMHWQRRNRKAA